MGGPFYVPFDQIKPLLNSRREPAIFIWQAFPWLTHFYTKFGALYKGIGVGAGGVRACLPQPTHGLTAASPFNPPTPTPNTKKEMNYDKVDAVQDGIRARWQIPIISVLIYAVVIFGGRRVMRVGGGGRGGGKGG